MELRKVICDTCGAKSLTNIPEGTLVRCFGCEGGMVTHEELKPSSVAEGIGAAIRCAYEQAERFSQELNTSKPTNPKDAVGIRKPPASCVPQTVMAEVGVGMLEGARKYGRHNYREVGVRASVYYDALRRHVDYWWEGEDLDPDSGLSHVTKAICCLVVLRDAMIQNKLTDDRPPKADVTAHRTEMQRLVNDLFERYPQAAEAFVEKHLDPHAFEPPTFDPAPPVELAEDRTCPVCGVPEGFSHKGWCETMQVQAKHDQCEACGAWGGAHTDDCENRKGAS